MLSRRGSRSAHHSTCEANLVKASSARGTVDNWHWIGVDMARLIIPSLELNAAMMLSTMMKDCLDYLRGVRGYSTSTAENYDRTFRQFLAYLRADNKKDELDSFTGETCFGFMEDLGRRGVRVNTILNKLAALSSLAVYGMQAHGKRGRPLLALNPTKTFRWPEQQESRVDILLPEEVRAYLEVDLPLAKAVIRDLFFDTGLRVSEIAFANVGDVQQIAGAWFIETAVKSRGRSRRRRFPISNDVAEHLKKYLAARRQALPDDPLLVRQDGERYTRAHIGQIIARIGKAAGITRVRVSPHKIRHMVNVWGRLGGADLYSRSRLLGHQSTASLAHYEHLIPNELVAVRAQQREGMRRYIREPETCATSENPGWVPKTDPEEPQ